MLPTKTTGSLNESQAALYQALFGVPAPGWMSALVAAVRSVGLADASSSPNRSSK